MSNNNSKKRNTMIGVGVALALTVGVGTYYVSQQSPEKEKEPTLEDQIAEATSTKMFAFTDNGVVTLYNSKDASELDSFDLKSLSTGKEIVIETKPVQPTTPAKEPAKVVTEEFEGFLRVPHKVVKGENSWKIQEALTPNRDTATMLKLVAKANGKTKLHPIFPGQTLYYLKEKDGSSPEKVVKEVETGEPIQKQEVEKVVKKVDDKAVYLYSKSEDFKTLYAYNDIEQTFYQVSEKDNKIEATALYTAEDMKGVKDFKVVDNHLVVVFENGEKVRQIDLSNDKHKKEYKLQGTPDIMAVRDGFFYYTFADKLGKIDLDKGEEQIILLGDKSTDYVFTKDKLFILNQFGSKLDNSVLMKVNPSDLKVDDLVELKSNQTAILSEETDTERILIGEIHKTTDLDKKVVKEPVVLPINFSNLQKDLFVKDVPFDKNALEVDGFIYEVKDGITAIYSGTNGKVVKEINVEEATKVMPLK